MKPNPIELQMRERRAGVERRAITSKKCPACQTTDLLPAERYQMKVYYCPACRGVWLEPGQLEKFRNCGNPPALTTELRRAPMPGGEDHRAHTLWTE